MGLRVAIMGSVDATGSIYTKVRGASIPGMKVKSIRLFVTASGATPRGDVQAKFVVGRGGRLLSYMVLLVELLQMRRLQLLGFCFLRLTGLHGHHGLHLCTMVIISLFFFFTELFLQLPT